MKDLLCGATPLVLSVVTLLVAIPSFAPSSFANPALTSPSLATSSAAVPSSSAQEIVSKVVALFINWNGHRLNQTFSNQAAQYIDYELMSSLVLGDKNWSKLSAAQQHSFVSAFRKLIEQRYYVRWHRIFKHGKVSYEGESATPPEVVVKTEIAVKEDRTVVNWKLRPGHGGYKIVSLSTDTRDLLEILRPRFNKVLSQRGFNGLMIWLNRRAVTS